MDTAVSAPPNTPARAPRWRTAARRIVSAVPKTLVFTALVFLVVLPVAALILLSLSDGRHLGEVRGANWTLRHYATFFRVDGLSIIWNSLVIGVVGSAMAMTIGGVLAWLAARSDIPARGLVQMSGMTSFFIPPLVGALAWALLASPRRGYFNLFFDQAGIPLSVNAYSLAGIIFVLGLYFAPYSFVLLYSAFSLTSADLEDAARVHGVGYGGAVRRITFPLVAPAVWGSALLTFTLIVENFAVPQILGAPAGIQTIPSQLYRFMNTAPARTNEVAALGVIFMGLIALVLRVQSYATRNKSFTTITGKGHRPGRVPLGRWKLPALAFVGLYGFLSVGLPLFAIAQMALRRTTFLAHYRDLFDPSFLGMDNFRTLWDTSSFSLGLRNSFVVAFAVAVLGGAFHLGLAYAVHRTRWRSRHLVRYLAVAPVAIPSLVLGVGFLWTWLAVPVPVSGTLLILMLAYVTRFMPQGYEGLSSSMRQVSAELEEAALVSGASRLRATWSVLLPLLARPAAAMALLLVILSFREITTTIFLYSTRSRVLSIVLFELWESGRVGLAAAASLVFCAVLLVVLLLTHRWMLYGPARAEDSSA